MINYFEEGFIIKRYTEASGGWSDGEGVWDTVDTTKGYIRALSATERSEVNELTISHRFYTAYSGLVYGDKIAKGQLEYNVKQVEHKHIKTSDLNFYQVDCELVV